MQQLVEQFELGQLPVLPQVLARLVQELNNENLQLRNLADLIGQDAGLTLKVLSVANSGYYNRRQSFTSIEQCINLLGLEMVKILAISTSMHQFLNHLSGMVPFNFGKFWQHSLMTAFLSRMIAQSITYPNPQEAYVAGLLHDVGQLAMLAAKTETYRELMQKHAEDDDLVEREAVAFGVTHCEIGAVLAERWNLEPLVVDAIRHHHDAVRQVASATELVRVVLLANVLSRVGTEVNHPALAVAHALFGMTADDALRLSAEANANMIALAIPLGVQIQDTVPDSPSGEGRLSASESAAVASQRQLHEEVRTTTMLALARDAFDTASSEDELLASILQSAMILFEPRQAFLFEWDAQTNLVSGRPIKDQPESIARIRFPLEADKSLIADALLWNTMTHSFNKSASDVQSMMDEQIVRLAGADGIFCVPMGTSKFMFGVLVLAYQAGVMQRLDSNLRFLTAFARQAAEGIFLLRRGLADDKQASGLELEAYKAHARQIVHEANNPLSILKNYLRILEHKLADSHPAVQELQVLNEEIDRVANIIRKFANPPEMREGASARVDVNAVIRDVVAVCDRSLFSPSGIRLDVRLDDDLPLIPSDPDSLKQVLINLFKNAAEAMSNGGGLTVTTAYMVSQGKAGSIAIGISDTGPGIPKEVLNSLFSPVKTTKGAGHAGLGLSIVANILNGLGGSISCKSAPGTGTTFDIVLPCQAQDSTGQGFNQSPPANVRESK